MFFNQLIFDVTNILIVALAGQKWESAVIAYSPKKENAT